MPTPTLTEPALADDACRNTAVDFFDRRRTPAARAVCDLCRVRTSCLEFAIAAGLDQGVWGPKTSQERHQIVTARRDAGITIQEATE